MAYYYKREIADLNGTGRRQFRYELRSEGLVGLKQLAAQLQRQHRAMSVGEIQGLGEALVRTMMENLADGYTVSIDGLGVFSLSLGLRDEERKTREGGAEPNARSVGVRGVNFRPERRFVREVDVLCRQGLKHEPYGNVEIRRPQGTREERAQRALRFIREHGFMRLPDFATLCGLSHSTASRELQALCKDPAVPIQAEGRRSHKIYVEARATEADN